MSTIDIVLHFSEQVKKLFVIGDLEKQKTALGGNYIEVCLDTYNIVNYLMTPFFLNSFTFYRS